MMLRSTWSHQGTDTVLLAVVNGQDATGGCKGPRGRRHSTHSGGTRYASTMKWVKKCLRPCWKQHSNRKMYQKNHEKQTWPHLSSSKINLPMSSLVMALGKRVWYWYLGVFDKSMSKVIQFCLQKSDFLLNSVIWPLSADFKKDKFFPGYGGSQVTDI